MSYRTRWGTAAIAAGLALIAMTSGSHEAKAWWRGGYGYGVVVPPVVVAPPPVYAPPPVVYAPPPVAYAPPPGYYYGPPRRVWIPPHWRGPYWVPGHWS